MGNVRVPVQRAEQMQEFFHFLLVQTHKYHLVGNQPCLYENQLRWNPEEMELLASELKQNNDKELIGTGPVTLFSLKYLHN